MLKKITIVLVFLVFTKATSQNTILWKVTDTINNKTSTLVGTFHQFGNSFVDSIPKLKELLYQSEIAIFEAIDDNGKILDEINARPNSDIKKKLKKKTYTKLVELSKEWNSNLNKLRPIELRYKLEQEFVKVKCNTVKTNDTWNHFDNYLQFLANQNNIEIFGLESLSEQIDFIGKEHNTPTWKKEKKAIEYLVNQMEADDFNKRKCTLANNYRKFELDYRFESDCMMDVILKERNNNWMQVLPKMLSEKNCFVAVGLFHLYNSCGLIMQLKEDGFLVEPIKLIPDIESKD